MTHLAGQHLKKNRQYVLLFNILFNCDDGEIWERTQLVSDDFTMTPMGGAIVYRCISFFPHSPFYEKKKERKKTLFPGCTWSRRITPERPTIRASSLCRTAQPVVWQRPVFCLYMFI